MQLQLSAWHAVDAEFCWGGGLQRLGGYTPRTGGMSGDAQQLLQQQAAMGLNPWQSATLLAQA